MKKKVIISLLIAGLLTCFHYNIQDSRLIADEKLPGVHTVIQNYII